MASLQMSLFYVLACAATYVTLCGASNSTLYGVESSTRRELAVASSLCVEKLSETNYIYMSGHPSNKNYGVFSNQNGLLQLAQIPSSGSKQRLKVLKTFLNLQSRVWNAGERGFLSFAFHPKYVSNGRLFVSYICDSNKHPDCKATCACNKDTNCVVGKRGTSCNGVTIIAEYRVTSPKSVSSVPKNAEVRRIMSYGRPFGNHMGGDIFFGKDGFLYITSGDGGDQGDPFKFAQHGMASLGKIFRVDVNSIPKGRTFGIPASNPFVRTKGILPQTFALGLRNPWRCSVDSLRGTIFCGDVGQNRVEEVDVIKAGYNYGWNRYEGTTNFNKSTAVKFGKLAGPMFQYAHYGVSVPKIPSYGFCVIGGLVYRNTKKNACLRGKYLFSDLGGAQFLGTVYPGKGSPSYKTVTVKCAKNSPISCNPNGLGGILSWGADKSNDAFIISTAGVYRIAEYSRCGLSC